MGSRIIAVCNQKGGVGKSTTIFHLSRAAIERKLKILLVDNDPQGNLTAIAAADELPEDQIGLADVLTARSDETLSDVIVPGVWEGLDVAPTTGEGLAVVRDELVLAGAGRELRLKEALREASSHYDIIFIDCAPALDQLTINGLSAATEALIVTHSKLWSANGLGKLLATVANVQKYYNPDLRIDGIIVNQHEAKTVSGQYWMAELTEVAASRSIPIFSPPVPKRTIIADATESSSSLNEWGKDGIQLATIYERYLQNIMPVPAVLTTA